MKKELIDYAKENFLSPFAQEKTQVKNEKKSFFKTKDARIVFQKTIDRISANFYFRDTENFLKYFSFTSSIDEIKKRQAFFRQIKKGLNNDFLQSIKNPKNTWKPKYQSIVVTEDEHTLSELKRLSIPVQFIINQDDIRNLESYDIIQVIDCEESKIALERLPQTVFLDSVDEAYLERYVELLSSWKNNIDLIKEKETTEEIGLLVKDISQLFYLLNDKPTNKINRDYVENSLAKINEHISAQIKQMTISGEELLSMLSKSVLSSELNQTIKQAISKTNLPTDLFNIGIPVSIDENELERLLKEQDAYEFTDLAEEIKVKAKELKSLPKKLEELSIELLIYDFIAGLSVFINDKENYPINSDELYLDKAVNLFLNEAQPITFCLTEKFRCSVLTGANSGGKTTLLEHIIQLITLHQLGLPINGIARLPLFTEIYYFAKTKGSASKGAFETLLTQMSQIEPGKKTLILADEIEAVTEPGVAGKIICATADYFIKKGCFLVIATHLGQEIQKNIPLNSRIDGIEAKGLDEAFNLIVDHNPVLGRLAHSTPELIVEKMASTQDHDYFNYLHKFLKEN